MPKKIKIVLTEYEANAWKNAEYLLPENNIQQRALKSIGRKIDDEMRRKGLLRT